MNRNTRTLIVLAVAAVIAGLASYGVYLAVKRMPVREVEVAHTFVVAAAHPISAGARLAEGDVKLVAWPEKAVVPGSFTKVDDIVNRGVLTPLLENEPLVETKLAPVEAGAGLTPTIPRGMRAISLKVDEVIGVAGFVTPGTRVDVFVTLTQPDKQQGNLTRMVLSNVQVLAAGTKYERDQNAATQAMPSSVVTLLLSPLDAEKVVLASNDGKLMLALRNPMDVEPTLTAGTQTANLFGDAAPAPAPAAPRVVTPRPRPVAAPPTPEPVAVKRYSVEAIRGAKRSEETLQ